MECKFVVLFAACLLGCLVRAGSSIEDESPVTFEKINSTVFKIISDESDGSFLVAARNQILRIDSSLKIVDSVQNGPLRDSNEDQDNVIIFLTNDTRRDVISCGTLFNGMCLLHDRKNLKNTEPIGNSSDPKNYVVSRKSTLVFPLPNTEAKTLLIAHEFDGRPLNHSPPTLSIRRLNTQEPSFEYADKSGSSSERTSTSGSVLDVIPEQKNYSFEFVYTFKHENFLYIISNENRMEFYHHSSRFVRIGRICLEDCIFKSYIETTLFCQIPPTHGFDPSVAVTAHFGVFGSDMDYLYVVFASPEGPNKNGSVVCGTRITKIENELKKVADPSNAELHPAFHFNNSTTSDFPPSSLTGTCNGHPNKTLRAESALFLAFLINFDEQQVTSFTSYKRENETFAFAGTKSGSIMKLLLNEESGSSSFTLLVKRKDTENGNESTQIMSSPVVSMINPKDEFALFANSTGIIKFPLFSCSIFTRCSDCLAAHPLKCKWCDQSCLRKKQCSKYDSTFEENNCPPVIHAFHPKSGPWAGGTKITVKGDSFGHPDEESTIISLKDTFNHSVGCTIISINMQEIICQLESSNNISNNFNTSIEVKVDKHQSSPGSYYFGGNTSSNEIFTIANPNITGVEVIHTERGEFIISGSDLDVGSEMGTILVSYFDQPLKNNGPYKRECNIITKNSSHIHCKIEGKWTYAGAIYGNVTMKIDSLDLMKEFDFMDGAYTETTGYNDPLFIILMVVILILSIVIMVACFFGTRLFKLGRLINRLRVNLTEGPNVGCQGLHLVKGPKLDALRAKHKIIQIEDLEIGNVIKSANSIVREGHFKVPEQTMKVAIKTFQSINSTKKMKELIDEAYIMMNHEHENVLSLVGLVLPKHEFPMIVTEFMENGDLKSYLEKNQFIPASKLIQFTLDIARGMEYLSACGIIHGDLAARNCMVDSNFVVRVADFGRSQNICPHAIHYGSTSSQGSEDTVNHLHHKMDVWSFAITSWVVLMRGQDQPPLTRSFISVPQDFVPLEKPSESPQKLYDLWKRCWAKGPEDRPTFTQIVKEIENYLKDAQLAPSRQQEKSLHRITSIQKELYRMTATEY